MLQSVLIFQVPFTLCFKKVVMCNHLGAFLKSKLKTSSPPLDCDVKLLRPPLNFPQKIVRPPPIIGHMLVLLPVHHPLHELCMLVMDRGLIQAIFESEYLTLSIFLKIFSKFFKIFSKYFKIFSKHFKIFPNISSLQHR